MNNNVTPDITNQLPINAPANDIPTDIELQTPAEIKAGVDEKYANKKNGGHKVVLVLVTLTLILIVVFSIGVLLFYMFGNSQQMHQIDVVNNCSSPIIFLIGDIAPTTSGTTGSIGNAIQQTINAHDTATFYASPGAKLVMRGYYECYAASTLDHPPPCSSSPNFPFTDVMLHLGGFMPNTSPYITNANGNYKISVPQSTQVDNDNDYYGVSMQIGYNIPVTIRPYAPQSHINDPSICGSPTWTGTIDETTCGQRDSYLDENGHYQGCQTPCTYYSNLGIERLTEEYCCQRPHSCSQTGGCDRTWASLSNKFRDACPQCMITNCDALPFNCGTASGNTTSPNGGLSQYTVTYCPTSSA